ncbi:competence type IV pilus major pilin ComGC [Amycolatopsis japonica]|uniref:competence type IV pilus major pilin ComGC n=1 Tax=Amycolatopsis japonica TaxID=208439 RepID=UPI0037A04FD8
MLQRLREARENESGFTLIELLIVIVILGVLAGVVVFAVQAFNNDGKAAACESDWKNVQVATEAYYAKNASTYPADVAALVSAGYLKEAPSTTNGYTVKTAGGLVTASGACTHT